MDELKQILELIKSSPNLFYKLLIIVSIYGTIRFIVGKLYDYSIRKLEYKEKTMSEEIKKKVDTFIADYETRVNDIEENSVHELYLRMKRNGE